MEEEIEAIERNDTWELVSLPKGKHVIGVKWVYKTKSNIEGKIERHKARVVVKGYKQSMEEITRRRLRQSRGWRQCAQLWRLARIINGQCIRWT